MIRYVLKEASVINEPGKSKTFSSRRKCSTENWQLQIWSCGHLCERTSCTNRARRNNCWIHDWFGWFLAAFSESVCSSADGWILFYTSELITSLEFSSKFHMVDCTFLWIVGLDVDCWSAKSLIFCCCRVSPILWSTPGDSGADGLSIWLLRDEAGLLARVEVSRNESSWFCTVCATSILSFAKHAGSLRKSSATTFSDCVSWSTS